MKHVDARGHQCYFQDEKVLPNAHIPQAQQGVPEALLDVEIAGVKTTLRCAQDQDAPEEMSGMSVFDSRCARAYLDEEQDVAYLPYGLDIVQNLGLTVVPTLAKRLDAEIRTCLVDRSAFSDLESATAVGKLITGLSAKTDKRQVESLATLTEEEDNRRIDVENALRAENPRANSNSGSPTRTPRLRSGKSRCETSKQHWHEQEISADPWNAFLPCLFLPVQLGGPFSNGPPVLPRAPRPSTAGAKPRPVLARTADKRGFVCSAVGVLGRTSPNIRKKLVLPWDCDRWEGCAERQNVLVISTIRAGARRRLC